MGRRSKADEVDELAETATRPRHSDGGVFTALLDAGEALIVEKGFARATIEEIAGEANVTLDIFYAHFQGKGALLRALNDRFVAQMIATIDAATRSGSWSNAPASALMEVAVRSILDVVFDHAPLVRSFLAHGATDLALSAGLRTIGTHLSKRLCASLGECPDVESIDPRAVAFALLTAVSVAHHSVLVGDSWSGVPFLREELTRETASAVNAYLGLDIEGELDLEASRSSPKIPAEG
jgi:AcrR family transcriptional regulator